MLWRIPADTHAQRIGPCRLHVPPPPGPTAGHPRPCDAAGLSPIGHSLAETAETAETAGTGRLPAGPKHWMQASGDLRFGHQCFFAQFFQGLGGSRAIILRLAPGVIALSHLRNRTVTCDS